MRNNSRIPRIIHQTWKTKDVPSPPDRLPQTWKEYLPNWKYTLWTDEVNREFVCEHLPDLLKKYDTYPYNIQKADVMRYLLLKVYGGLYVDMGFECLESIEFLLEESDFIVSKEPDQHAKRFGFEYIICNTFMAPTPDNDFIDFVCQRLTNHSGGEVVSNGFDMLDSTSPFLLTHAFSAFSHKEDIRILESETIYPIGQWEIERIKNNQIPKEMEERVNQTHAIHYFLGTWSGK